MPSFDGQDLGPFVFMQTEANPNDLQINQYPGVDGLEILNLGARGGITHCQGACYADNLADLSTLEQLFRSAQVNATSGDLVDSEGTSWPNVIIQSYRPVGPILEIQGFGIGREYKMTFLHAS